jgi:hypothetical protein
VQFSLFVPLQQLSAVPLKSLKVVRDTPTLDGNPALLPHLPVSADLAKRSLLFPG